MSKAQSKQAALKKPSRSLRDYLGALEEHSPGSILHIKDKVSLDYEMTAIAMELERRGQSPVLWFDHAGDGKMPVVANVFGNRQRFAFTIGVPESDLLNAWGRLGDKLLPPQKVSDGPVLETVFTGSDVDLGRLPIPRHFAEDGGAYITNGIVVRQGPR